MRKYLITKAHKLNRRRDIRAKAAHQAEALRPDVAQPNRTRKALRNVLTGFCAVLAVWSAVVPAPALARSGGGNHGHHSK